MEPIVIIIPIMICAALGFSVSALVVIWNMYPELLGLKPAKKTKKGKGKPKPKSPTTAPGQAPAPGQPAAPAAPNPAADTPYSLTYPKDIGTDCPAGKRGVIGYDNRWKDGAAWMWCTSDPAIGAENKESPGKQDHDKMSFLSVPQGMKATIYENNNYGGLVKTFEAGEWDLHDQTFENGHQIHDRASSIRIEGTPPNGVAA